MKFLTKALGVLVALATTISVYQPAFAAAIRPAVALAPIADGGIVKIHRRGYYHRHRRYRRGRRVGAGIALGVIGGAIIGGAIARDRARRREIRRGYSSRHVRWCYNRYRSYQERSNTWVSNSGRVRQCRSPYY